MTRKEQIITALQAFIAQRSGMDYRNYGDVKSYRSEQRSITRDLHDARGLLKAVSWRDSITAEDLLTAAKHAYSGRLEITVTDDNKVRVDYCTGQYFPTEYRKAVAAVCARALWSYQRSNMTSADGNALRQSFKREFGARMQKRWFD